ncbi:iron complex outermembrane receptor protein [Catalinimonas alkaloidigena]|uniref:TonB-dependent receptor domain-containing protein n=1 Tax=Catalinimonas alkaloidigena TaxID=1075417 RepID=UPI00240593D4|nr:TonB-dependent receptor [Catalinimonas alkaloidigena]MDF9800345.1 iron complex outermembrane receptor protein [Catalinimonas alkaloidigena]
MTKSICLSFFLTFLLHQLSAQQAIIHGSVVDQSSDAPLEYANVVLFSPADSSIVSGVVTQADGAFKLENLSEGLYYLQVQFVGYESKKLDDIQLSKAQTYDAGAISLQANEQLLNEIQVSGQKATTYHKIDRQVYNAGQFQSAMGGTATDVLRNVPSVAVNAEGGITVRGSSGFTILLNGKPIQGDPTVILNQLPANAIEDVEIVTAPSAKYDPEGKAGIINIITRKGATDGLFLQVNAKVGLPSIEPYDNAEPARRFGGDFTLNYRKDKWDIALGASYLRNDIAGRREGDVYTIINDTLTRFPSDGERSFDEEAYTARATIGYTPDENNNFSLGLYAGKRSKDRTADILYNNSKVYRPENDTISQITYYNENLRIRRGDFLISSLDYAHTFENESSLSASLLYEYTMLGGPTTNLNLSWPTLLDTLQDQYNTNDNPLHGIRFQLDYSKSLGQGKLDVGYQFRNLDHQGDFFYEERIIGMDEYAPIPEFSSTVDLNRRIHSLYGQYSGKWDKLSYAAGMRMEIMDRQLVLANQFVDTTYNYDFVKLYPSANLLYDWSESFRLKAAYSKRVERTTTFKMNSFPEREHSETLEQGDAELLPEFIDLAELGAIKDFGDNSVFVTAYFQDVQNLINRVNTVYNDTILNRIYSNVGRGRSYGLEAGAELNPTDWWQLYAGGNVYNNNITGEFAGEPVRTSSWIYSINANTTFKISPDFSVQWTLNYISDQNTAQGEDSRFLSPNLTVQKSFLDKRLIATLQWLNMDMGLLPTNEQRITTWGDDPETTGVFYTTTNYVYEVDMIMLNLSFRINQPAGKSRFIKSEFGEQEF